MPPTQTTRCGGPSQGACERGIDTYVEPRAARTYRCAV